MPRASTFASPRLLIPLAALLATLPLILHGNSCGQDLTFHLQSWIDAARQLRHGHYPRWDATAAWNAGEPRFLFYPPLSWLLGATLTLILPIVLPTNAALDAAPIAFIFIALLASGLTFHKLARSFVDRSAALIASAFYLANPYMLFNVFERSALAELLAAAWIPLLLLVLLRPRPTLRGIAIPLALLWLTNVPAAVMGSYLLALLAILRIASSLLSPETCSSNPNPSQASAPPQTCHPERSDSRAMRIAESKDPPPTHPGDPDRTFQPQMPGPMRLTLTYLAGTLLGFALPAFYLLPAATERPLIQATMALIPPLRYQDNFLFTHTSDAAHSAVNHTASLLALTLLLLTAATLFALFIRRTKSRQGASVIPSQAAAPRAEAALIPSQATAPRAEASLIPSQAAAPRAEASLIPSQAAAPRAEASLILSGGAGHHPAPQSKDPNPSRASTSARTLPPTRALLSPSATPKGTLLLILALLTLLIAFLLTPLSTPIWRHLPELAFLQFPWRLLTLLTPILALATAILLDRLFFSPPDTPSSRPDLEPRAPSIPPHSVLSTEGRGPQWRDPRSPDAPFIARFHRAMNGVAAIFIATLLPLTLSLTAHHLFSQTCDPTGTPTTLARNLATHHSTLPTDEYTPADADNDLLRTGNPGSWLAPLANPNAPAPHTVPTATELNPSIDTDDTPVPLSQTLSTPAPHHLKLNLTHPAVLVLNLRAYPNWHITVTTANQQLPPSTQGSTHNATLAVRAGPALGRDDGLLAIALPSGLSTIDIVWHRSTDQTLGLAISALALLLLALTFR